MPYNERKFVQWWLDELLKLIYKLLYAIYAILRCFIKLNRGGKLIKHEKTLYRKETGKY